MTDKQVARGGVAPRTFLALMSLIVVQSLCAVFFLADAVADFNDLGMAATADWHLMVEAVAALSLLLAVAFELRSLLQLLRRQAQVERGLTIAQGALHDLMEAYFREWKLTPSEADVAGFALKGASITEIARLRGSAEGTVKAHLNAIYRKAGVSGRGELVSLMIEDLMGQPLIPDAEAA